MSVQIFDLNVQYLKIKNIEELCKNDISLPIHTEVKNSGQEYIINQIKTFYKKK